MHHTSTPNYNIHKIIAQSHSFKQKKSLSLESLAIVPVRAEVGDVKVEEDGIDPGQHQLLGRRLAAPDLVAKDEAPDQAEDQLEVAAVDILGSCGVMQKTMALIHKAAKAP